MRKPELVGFGTAERSVIRGQRFSVERIAARAGAWLEFASTAETILLAIEATVRLGDTRIGPRTAAILPPGPQLLEVEQPGRLFLIATDREEGAPWALNAATYATPDPRVRPIGPPFQRRRGGPAVYPLDDLPTPPGNDRLKFLQSATMSINWVEYDGPRDRTQLSPHSHADFEQGSLAIDGGYVHHLRTPWGPNADSWRDDLHLPAGAETLLVIPPEVIHTTEGVDTGRHILIDIFAPPRRDFIAKGWVHNAADYADPETVAAS